MEVPPLKRIFEHPILGLLQSQPILIEFDGKDYPALEGDSVASALLANDVRTLRFSQKEGLPRGIYCGIGHCYECRVTINGIPSVRACITPAADGDVVTSKSPLTEGES